MDIYRAIANFTAPQLNSQGRPIHTCLSFKKGDLFEVLESENERLKSKVWWACRTITDDRKIGYVPSKYLKFHEKRPGNLKESSPPPATAPFQRGVGGDHIRSAAFDARDIRGKALADLRQHAGEAPPNDLKVKDPVLSPSSPTAPNPASSVVIQSQQQSQRQSQHSVSSSSPSMMRSSATQQQPPPSHSHQRQSPVTTAHSTPPSKLSPSAIRVPFMAPLLPGSPMAPQSSSPPSSSSKRERFLRSDDQRNDDAQCNHYSSSSPVPPRSDVIDLCTAFPAWNAGHRKAVAPASGGADCCTHNQHNQHAPSSKDIANQYQRLSSKTNSEYYPQTAQSQEPGMVPSASQIVRMASPARKHQLSSQPSQPQPASYPSGSPELRRNREGLIEPKKLVNPCLESKERQVLHRELLQISTTQGEMSAMLPKKSELRQVFEKRQEKQREKDKETKTKPEFEKELEEHVEKLQKHFHVGEENLFQQLPVEDERVVVKKIPSSPLSADNRSKSTTGNQSQFVRMRAKLAEKPKS